MPWVADPKGGRDVLGRLRAGAQAVGDGAPEGLIYHAAGEQPNVNWQAVRFLESEEHVSRFRDARLLPAVHQVMGEGVAHPEQSAHRPRSGHRRSSATSRLEPAGAACGGQRVAGR
jgi:hypothetical protein